MQDKKETRTLKLQMINEWQQSGLSQKAFCTSNNIAYHVFHYWYRVYRSDQTATPSFLPVNIRPAASQEQITLTGHNGIEVRLPFSDQSTRFVKQLLLS